MTHNHLVRSMQFVNHVLSVFAIWYVFETGMYWWLVISLVTYYLLVIFGGDIGLHRLLAHRSFQTNVWIERALLLLSVPMAVGSPIAWVAAHRQHHRYADSDQDPHSPHQIGMFKAWFGFWLTPNYEPRLIKDLTRDNFHKFLHRRYATLLFAWILLLLLIDPLLLPFVYALPATLVMHSSAFGNCFGHTVGYRTYDLGGDRSTNNFLVTVLTGGEGWHNNHHANPGHWKQGERWWEIDPPSWVIWLIKH